MLLKELFTERREMTFEVEMKTFLFAVTFVYHSCCNFRIRCWKTDNIKRRLEGTRVKFRRNHSGSGSLINTPREVNAYDAFALQTVDTFDERVGPRRWCIVLRRG